ncbi:hypothetical protein PRK78_004427 [Emydomyces testavorans]|uniref:Uncharacterized protein n=1 Tax=Emydomyces testavorans TaxID=2070801 RepID=A0AAF0DHS4_9EURO|nr:hypothetical protein PRK78_004427 [Emydomyces testavorans]
MPYFVNPFRKNDATEYPGVLIPLAEEENGKSSDVEEDKKLDASLAEKGSSRTTQTSTTLTLDVLRAEVESDVAASSHDSAYDRLGVGGNLPVDGALFLEFLPFASGNLLTMLSVWWPVGQLIGRFDSTDAGLVTREAMPLT